MSDDFAPSRKRVVLRYEDHWDQLQAQLAADRAAGLGHSAVRDAVAAWLDPGSWVEVGALVRQATSSYRGGDAPVEPTVGEVPAGGLIAGWGRLAGGPVFVIADDPALGSAVRGPAADAKAQRIRGHALDQARPLVQILAAGRVGPDTPTAATFARFGHGVDLEFEADASERVLKIVVVTAALHDQAAFEATAAHLVVLAGPDAAVFGHAGEEALRRGLADCLADDLPAALAWAGAALRHLPPSVFDGPPDRATAGRPDAGKPDPDRSDPRPPDPVTAGPPDPVTAGRPDPGLPDPVTAGLPDSGRAGAVGPATLDGIDGASAVSTTAVSLLDDGWRLELGPGTVPGVRTVLGLVGGRPVAVVDAAEGVVLDAAAARKVHRLVRFCEALRLPSVVAHGGLALPGHPGVADIDAVAALGPALASLSAPLLELGGGGPSLLAALGVRPVWSAGPSGAGPGPGPAATGSAPAGPAATGSAATGSAATGPDGARATAFDRLVADDVAARRAALVEALAALGPVDRPRRDQDERVSRWAPRGLQPS